MLLCAAAERKAFDARRPCQYTERKAGGRVEIPVCEVRGFMETQPTEVEIQEESRRIRRLQLMMNLVMSVISQGISRSKKPPNSSPPPSGQL